MVFDKTLKKKKHLKVLLKATGKSPSKKQTTFHSVTNGFSFCHLLSIEILLVSNWTKNAALQKKKKKKVVKVLNESRFDLIVVVQEAH